MSIAPTIFASDFWNYKEIALQRQSKEVPQPQELLSFFQPQATPLRSYLKVPLENSADPVPPPIRHPLHHLWAQLEPAQVSEKRFQGLRTAYREEVRRLRVWTATFVGDVLLPSVAETHFVSCNALPNLGDRHVR